MKQGTGKKSSGSRKKSRSLKVFPKAPAERAFWIWNGPVVRDIRELALALHHVSDEQFDYHAKRGGNDFACWARDVLGEKALARSLVAAKTKTKTLDVLKKYLT